MIGTFMARTTHEAVLFLEQATAHNTNFLSVSRQDLNLEARFFLILLCQNREMI